MKRNQMKRKMNNKGFSLVELIVVMAIMAILAVTLAPRLTHYVEKSRKAADREVINSIYTAVQYGLVDEDIKTDAFTTDSDSATAAGIDLAALASDTGLSLNVDTDGTATTSDIYKASGKVWTTNKSGTTGYTYATNKFIQEIYEVVGNFKLKSDDADNDTTIIIKANKDNETISVALNYDGTGTADYTVDSSSVK